MNIKIIAVGKIKEKWLKEGIAEYIERISRYCNISICEIPDCPESTDIRKDISIEGDKILSKIANGEYVIALAIDGTGADSLQFADKFSSWMEKGGASIAFVIGGSNGLSEDVLQRADDKISFSKLTFPHRLMRLILLEQIFRANKINNNEKYHK